MGKEDVVSTYVYVYLSIYIFVYIEILYVC